MIDLDDRIRTAVGDILDAAPDIGDEQTHLHTRAGNRGSGFRMGVAIGAVITGVAGTALLAGRSFDHQTSVPTASDASATSPPLEIGDGHLTIDRVPDGMLLTYFDSKEEWGADTSDAASVFDNAVPVTRFYAVDRTDPESAPAILVTYEVWGGTGPDRPGGEAVEINGMQGTIWKLSPDVVELWFGPVEGHSVSIDGYHVSRDQLLRAASAVEITASREATIPLEALPAGASELAAGLTGKFPLFIPDRLSVGEVTMAEWRSEDGDRVIDIVTADDSALLRAVNRFGFESVTDIEIGGLHGFLGVNENGGAILISDGRRLLLVTAWGLTVDQLIGVAESIRPATPEEWAEMESTRDR